MHVSHDSRRCDRIASGSISVVNASPLRPSVSSGSRSTQARQRLMSLALPLLLGSALVSGVGCQTTPTAPSSASPSEAMAGSDAMSGTDPQPASNTALFVVNGMGCPLCANNVEKQLRSVPGVERVTINLGTGIVAATLSPSNPPSQAVLERAVRDSGFTLVSSQMPADAEPSQSSSQSTIGGAP